jgi:hypothetical protein
MLGIIHDKGLVLDGPKIENLFDISEILGVDTLARALDKGIVYDDVTFEELLGILGAGEPETIDRILDKGMVLRGVTVNEWFLMLDDLGLEVTDRILDKGVVRRGVTRDQWLEMLEGVDIEVTDRILDKGLVLRGFEFDHWLTVSVDMEAEKIDRFLDKGFVTTGAPDLTWSTDQSQEVLDRLLDKGVAGCHSGPPEAMFAEMLTRVEAAFVPGETYFCFVDDGSGNTVEGTCELTLADVWDRLLDRGIASEGLDFGELPVDWSLEQIARILDKGIVACGVRGLEDVMAAAEATHIPSGTAALDEVLDRILDRGALHGWQTTPMRDAWAHIGFGMNSGLDAYEALIDRGPIVTGANQPLWRWLLTRGFSNSGPSPQWVALLERGLAITVEDGDAVVRSVENWLSVFGPQ